MSLLNVAVFPKAGFLTIKVTVENIARKISPNPTFFRVSVFQSKFNLAVFSIVSNWLTMLFSGKPNVS